MRSRLQGCTRSRLLHIAVGQLRACVLHISFLLLLSTSDLLLPTSTSDLLLRLETDAAQSQGEFHTSFYQHILHVGMSCPHLHCWYLPLLEDAAAAVYAAFPAAAAAALVLRCQQSGTLLSLGDYNLAC
jgi:hypothetical protein